MQMQLLGSLQAIVKVISGMQLEFRTAWQLF